MPKLKPGKKYLNIEVDEAMHLHLKRIALEQRTSVNAIAVYAFAKIIERDLANWERRQEAHAKRRRR